jgi:AcrR family transcriptional regulator
VTGMAAMRTGVARGTQRREELLGQLIDLVLRDGFAQLSIEDMARLLRCSKSTVYAIATSKEQVIVAVVREFFRRATEHVEARLQAADLTEVDRIETYLMAISGELGAASPEFFADVDAYPPAREIYRANTLAASRRVQQLVRDAIPAPRRHEAEFLGAVAAHVMEAIHRGDIETEAHLVDSAAYRALSQLIVAGVEASAPRAADPAGAIPLDRRRTP